MTRRLLSALVVVLVLGAGAGLALAIGDGGELDRACDDYRAAVQAARGDGTRLQREVAGYVAASERLRGALDASGGSAERRLGAELRAGERQLQRIRDDLEAGRNLAAMRRIARYNRRNDEGNRRIRAAEREAGLEGCTGL